MCDTSNNAARRATMQMLGEDAGGILDRHLVAGERHHLRTEFAVQSIQWDGLERNGLVAGRRDFDGQGDGTPQSGRPPAQLPTGATPLCRGNLRDSDAPHALRKGLAPLLRRCSRLVRPSFQRSLLPSRSFVPERFRGRLRLRRRRALAKDEALAGTRRSLPHGIVPNPSAIAHRPPEFNPLPPAAKFPDRGRWGNETAGITFHPPRIPTANQGLAFRPAMREASAMPTIFPPRRGPLLRRTRRFRGRPAAGRERLRECHDCGLLQTLAPPPPRTVARCPRCHAVLQRARSNPIGRGLALSLTGLLLFAMATSLPFIQVHLSGITRATTLVTGPAELEQLGMWPLAVGGRRYRDRCAAGAVAGAGIRARRHAAAPTAVLAAARLSLGPYPAAMGDDRGVPAGRVRRLHKADRSRSGRSRGPRPMLWAD